jgi:ABC-2 type transport system ATP-binding protein
VKSFKAVRAVDGIDLEVGPGERVALLGPNGAGKTTTLLMLLGAITPDEGTVEIAGHRLPKGRSKAMAEVGFVAGYLPLPDRLRVREALAVFAGFYGMRPAVAEAAIAGALERFRIPHLANRMCMELSSGQRTLVGIVKATLHRPKLLVLDEPTASLDPDVAYRVRTGLLDVCATEGTALLVTSHNMLEVERLCERVVFIAGGRVVADGSPEDVLAAFGHGDLEALFMDLAGTTDADDLGALP